MKALVIYDSQFGNTEQVARAIGDALGAEGEAMVLHAAAVTAEGLRGRDLIVVGSPTQSFHATKPVAELLNEYDLHGVRAAAFDTRFDMAEVESRVLRFAVKAAGDNAYAAPRIATQLEKAGATLAAEPEGFIVEGTEGPLRPGELERAAVWAKSLLAVPAA
ncbi:MAG: flavodoxin family protein [Candidatus Promineofilum sp.]|nr:flavodoxin family protein [Promineifilum sp.]